jgi:putative thioredoxin
MVVEVADFEQDVIERSRERPVLVDFWAPWCGPCRVLGPVLEKLAAENEDAWTLAKLNTDENPTVASRYAIRSIPAVKLFVDGEVKDEFVGALPEASVRQWLARAIPSPQQRLLAEAKAAIDAGDGEVAAQMLAGLLEAQPDAAEARVLMARLLALREPLRAVELARDAHGVDPGLYPTREAVLAVGRLLERASKPETLPDGPAKQPYLAAARALTAGEIDAALADFVKAVRLDRRYDGDGARRACIALFTLLGEQHELTRKHRRALEMALF